MKMTRVVRKLELASGHLDDIPIQTEDYGDLEKLILEASTVLITALEIARDSAIEE